MDSLTRLEHTTVSRLGLKLALLATVVPISALLAFGELSASNEREALGRAQEARARTWAAALEAALAAPLAAGDDGAVDATFRALLQREPDVAFAYVLDEDGRRIAVHEGHRAVSDEAPEDIPASDVAVRRMDVLREGVRRGTVVVALDLTSAECTIALRRANLWRTRITVGLGTALCLLLALRRQVLGPVRRLARAARQIGAGDLETPVRTARRDELGDLARTLDETRVRLRDTLHGLQAEREHQLHTLDQLAAALEQAKAGDLAKRRFLATMSHEVRTPLNGILGLVQVLELGELDEDQRAVTLTLRRSAEGLHSILTDILDYSTLDADEVALAPRATDAAREIAEVVELAEAAAEERPVAVHCDVSALADTRLVLDSLRVRQVVWNIVANAVKYTPQGEVQVEAVLEPRAPDPDAPHSQDELVLRIEVRDTGVGIPADALDRIFEPFAVVDGRDCRASGGTGLGLAITKQLVHLMGGALGVHSEVGVGSQFWVELPTRRADPAAAHSPRRALTLAARRVAQPFTIAARPLAAERPRSTPDGRARVLIAEDNPVNQAVLCRLLEHRGHDVLLAQDGEEAIERRSEAAPTLILMDCQMPRLDGFGATRRIRELERERGSEAIPIIAVTANALPGDRERCLGAGMSDYVAKPIDVRELDAALARFIGQGRAHAA